MVLIFKNETNEFFTKDKEYKVVTPIAYDEVLITNDKGKMDRVVIDNFKIK